MSKLTNLKGRINYISSKARQENLYAVYETTGRKFWAWLAECNQQEFAKSGTEGKCIEARELIIALPESFTEYDPDALLKIFTDHFKQQYGVECIAALHHNKRKTNYHIHLIFSERKLLDEPEEKIASRNMFYDESGKHVRTKKEITDTEGNLRNGCRIIRKGEVYERNIFTIKDPLYKSEHFLDAMKQSYTELINLFVKDEKEKLTVFNRDGVYLPMKKIGKNNPKAEEIAADNQVRREWNSTVDQALITGVTEEQIKAIKHEEVSDKARESVRRFGNNPKLFAAIIVAAILVLELLTAQVFKKREKAKGVDSQGKADLRSGKKETNLSMPVRPALAAKYPKLQRISGQLKDRVEMINARMEEKKELEKELTETKGIFKGSRREELQKQINDAGQQIREWKHSLAGIVQQYGYKDVKEFQTKFAKAKMEEAAYENAVAEWEKVTGKKAQPETLHGKLERIQKEVKGQERSERGRKKIRGEEL